MEGICSRPLIGMKSKEQQQLVFMSLIIQQKTFCGMSNQVVQETSTNTRVYPWWEKDGLWFEVLRYLQAESFLFHPLTEMPFYLEIHTALLFIQPLIILKSIAKFMEVI